METAPAWEVDTRETEVQVPTVLGVGRREATVGGGGALQPLEFGDRSLI